MVNIGYKYRPNIGATLFNYNKTLKNTNIDDDLPNCDCSTTFSDFVHGPHGHVHTGDLKIIENLELRDIMAKGAKFREMPACNKAILYDIFDNVVYNLKCKLVKSGKLSSSFLDKWQDFLIKKIKSRILRLSNEELSSNGVLHKEYVKNYIRFLHERFVLVPIDKASNNFSIICKKN